MFAASKAARSREAPSFGTVAMHQEVYVHYGCPVALVSDLLGAWILLVAVWPFAAEALFAAPAVHPPPAPPLPYALRCRPLEHYDTGAVGARNDISAAAVSADEVDRDADDKWNVEQDEGSFSAAVCMRSCSSCEKTRCDSCFIGRRTMTSCLKLRQRCMGPFVNTRSVRT